jgi:tetratricopeptide (TPR) repeat protein
MIHARPRTIAILLAAIVVSALPASARRPQRQPDRADRADRADRDADPTEAIPRKNIKDTRLEETRTIDPEEASATEAMTHLRFANQFFQQGMTAQARGEVEKALQIQPVFPEASYVLGLIQLDQNDFQGALASADRALGQNPFLTEAHNLKGLALAKMGNLDEALREFEIVKADASFPTPEVAHFNIGKVFWERQACGEAVLHFRRALEINPQFWRAWYLLGDCQEMLGQKEQARQSYSKALEIAPSETGPAYRLGFTCFQLGDFACARSWFTKVLEQSPSSDMAAGAREYMRQMNFK